MTSAHLLAAAVLLCTACAFSQEQSASANRPNRTAEPENSAQAHRLRTVDDRSKRASGVEGRKE